MRMIFLVQMYTGLRIGEVIRLKRSNFNRQFTRLTFMPLKKRKPIVHERVIPDFLARELCAYHHGMHRKYRHGCMFPPYMNGSKNSHIQRATVHYWWSVLRKDLKLDKQYFVRKDGRPLYRMSSHTLRHYAAYRFYKASGHDIKAVQHLLCH